MTKWLFRDELQLMEINLPRAALQLARTLEYPDLNVAAYMASLHEIGQDAADRIDPGLSVSRQAEILSNFLFEEIGFRGDKNNYNDLRNSYLNEVIDRRLGIPITLSVIFIDIAERVGIPAYGINLPGHFIVGVRDEDRVLWLDPFHGGRLLDLRDCAELIRLSSGYEGPIEAGWFQPAPARIILARMLGNLRANYVSANNWSQAAEVIQLLRQVQPSEPDHLRDLGLVYYHQRRLPLAAHYLNTYFQARPDASDAQVIRDGIQNTLDQWVPMN
ncbi:MAG: tetratricopeptide repeat protein [Anaerolineae bacterium]|nr:tetratricopeptide repeat protein [Anaerolineae bacterium]RIK23837.1 MAG: hypothetical protein DCC51_02370 [Anaerolineae bacterium]